MGDCNRLILNSLFLGILIIGTLLDIVIIFKLPFGVKLLILLNSVAFLWGIFAFVRKRLRYFIGFCVINLAPILILINAIAIVNSDNDNVKYILINNNKDDEFNYHQKKFILIASILKIIIEVIFIIITIIICNINYEETEKSETEESGETVETVESEENKDHKEISENIYTAYKLFNFFLYLSLYFILIMDGIITLFVFEFEDIKFQVVIIFCLVIPIFSILYFSIKPIKQDEEGNLKYLKYLIFVDIFLCIQMGYCIALLLYIGSKYKNYRNYCNIITIPIITMISLLLTIITSILFHLKSKYVEDGVIKEFLKLYLIHEYKLHSDDEYDDQPQDENDDDDEHEYILTIIFSKIKFIFFFVLLFLYWIYISKIKILFSKTKNSKK